MPMRKGSSCPPSPSVWSESSLSAEKHLWVAIREFVDHYHEERPPQGVGNELIHANAARIAAAGIPLILRVPLIPGINDSEENLDATARFAAGLGVPVEILPYHALGEAHRRLKLELAADSVYFEANHRGLSPLVVRLAARSWRGR